MRWGICVGLLMLTSLAQAAELRELRVWDSPSSTRIVFDVSSAAKPEIFTLDNPYRVVVDLPGFDAGSIQRAGRAEPKGLVRQIRSGAREQGVRVVLDVAEAVNAKSFVLAPNEQYGHRIIVDLAATSAAAVTPAPGRPQASSRPQVQALAPPPAAPSVATLQMPEDSSKRSFERPLDKPLIIAIDAGHGGEDPGAIGASGLREKDVSLAIARKLALLINTQPNMRAVLTRDGDYYVGLRQRTEFARRHQADMFVSVHCNAFTRRDMRGTAVYVLSDRGVSTEHSRWLANKENAADLVGGVDLHNKDSDLAAVLIDLSQSATMEASFDVGTRILRSMGQLNMLQKDDVQQAAFVVLKAPDIPSVLVETAFITNPQEEKLLGDEDYQSKLAVGMLSGIKGYFQTYRPKQQMVEAPAPQPAISRAAYAQQAASLRGALRDASFTQGVSH